MSRIQTTFAALAAQQRKALIPYVCAGDPFGDIHLDVADRDAVLRNGFIGMLIVL